MKLLAITIVLLNLLLIRAEITPKIRSSGNSPSDGSSRIIQGQPASLGQFPYLAKVQNVNPVRDWWCAGSLISSRHILTTATCLSGARVIIAGLGSIDQNRPLLELITDKYLIHPQFNPANLNNDIGIVDLETHYPLSSVMRPILLPTLRQLNETFEGEESQVAGWGRTENDGAESQYVTYNFMSVIGNGECASEYSPEIVINSTVCAVGLNSTEHNVCDGDSGGALTVTEFNNIPILVGIVSFVSTEPCDAGKPSGYVRPHFYWQWIHDYTGIPIRV